MCVILELALCTLNCACTPLAKLQKRVQFSFSYAPSPSLPHRPEVKKRFYRTSRGWRTRECGWSTGLASLWGPSNPRTPLPPPTSPLTSASSDTRWVGEWRVGVILFLHLNFIVCLLLYIYWWGFRVIVSNVWYVFPWPFTISVFDRTLPQNCLYIIIYITCIHHTFAGHSGNAEQVTVYSVSGFAGT